MCLQVVGFITLSIAIGILLKGESDKIKVLENIKLIGELLEGLSSIDSSSSVRNEHGDYCRRVAEKRCSH